MKGRSILAERVGCEGGVEEWSSSHHRRGKQSDEEEGFRTRYPFQRHAFSCLLSSNYTPPPRSIQLPMGQQRDPCMTSEFSCSSNPSGAHQLSIKPLLNTQALTPGTFKEINLLLLYVCVCFADMYICGQHVCLVPVEVRRGCQVSWNCKSPCGC